MKTIVFIAGLFLVVFCPSCDWFEHNRYYTTIRIYNESDQDIFTYLAVDRAGGTAYPDTTLYFERKFVDGGARKPGGMDIYDFHPRHEEFFGRLPSDTLSIFIFSADTLAKYTWEQIQEDYNVLVRYDLSLQDLEDLNFDVIYPPGDAMEHMEIYRNDIK